MGAYYDAQCVLNSAYGRYKVILREREYPHVLISKRISVRDIRMALSSLLCTPFFTTSESPTSFYPTRLDHEAGSRHFMGRGTKVQ